MEIHTLPEGLKPGVHSLFNTSYALGGHPGPFIHPAKGKEKKSPLKKGRKKKSRSSDIHFNGIVLAALISAPDLARSIHKKLPAVESFLRRLRKKLVDCYQEVEQPRRNEPKYLYRTADIWPELQQKLPEWPETDSE